VTVSFPGSKALSAATLLLVISLLSACTVVTREPARQPQLGAVPAIEGLNLAAAEATLERAGFHLGTVTKKTTRKAPSGTVLWQEPAPNTLAYEGTAVDLLLARQMASIPRLRGLRLETAQQVLQGAGFHLGQVTEEPAERRPQGSVIAQSPKASRLAEQGSAVDLVVARAQPRVPKVKGDPLKAARKALKRAGLQIGEIREKVTVKWLDGTVIRQRPRANKRVEPGTPVDLVVARAPHAVPRLGGLGLKRAKKALKRAGLALGKVTRRTTDEARAGIVIAQAPGDDAYVAPNTPVDLVIARAAPRVPQLSGQSLKKAKKSLKKAGLPLGQVTKQTTDRARPGTVIAQSPAAATPATPGIRVDLVIAQAAAKTQAPAPRLSPARQGESAPNGTTKARINPSRADESPRNGKAKSPPRD